MLILGTQANKEVWNEKNKAKYSFLTDIMDENRRRPGDPDYDPRTLFIPHSSFLQMTPFERQYWEIKRRVFDSVVFFNKGMFFELFELDADVGQKELGFNLSERAGMRMVRILCNILPS
jgi:DNA mismatch repair protein MSH6